MRRQTLLTLLTAAMVVLAGCAGSTGDDGSPTADGTATSDAEPDVTDGDGDATDTTATGTVQFYVSDDPGQIEDFRHLNVTISRIGFERAGGAGEEIENGTEPPENETEMPESIEDGSNETTVNGTTADGGVALAPQADSHESANGTTTPDEVAANQTDSDGEVDVNETESGEVIESDDDEAGEGGDGWITHNVSARSVDLTQLRGDNATLVGSPELPAGDYTKVFVYVSEINATLTDGTSVNVKLPSNKLQLNKGFSLEPNGTVSFVYDITVFKAGNSGKYILKPVISQSGPDQQVTDVDDRSGEGNSETRGPDDRDESDGPEADTPEERGPENGSPPEDRGRN